MIRSSATSRSTTGLRPMATYRRVLRPIGQLSMLGHDDGVASFAPGSTIVRRDVFDGRVWSALPGRVLSDDGAALVFGYWPGSEGLVPTSWIDWVRSGDEERRADAFADLAGGQWTLGRWTWQWTNVVHTTAAGQWFSVNSFFSATSGER